jgi:CrcB protein
MIASIDKCNKFVIQLAFFMNLPSIVSVSIGAAMGGVFRFFISDWFKPQLGRFPIATCSINILGSFLLGIIVAWSLKNPMPTSIKLFLTTGFCGGFTTFSTFSMDWLGLMQRGHIMMGTTYVLVSVLGGLFFAWIGFRII